MNRALFLSMLVALPLAAQAHGSGCSDALTYEQLQRELGIVREKAAAQLEMISKKREKARAELALDEMLVRQAPQRIAQAQKHLYSAQEVKKIEEEVVAARTRIANQPVIADFLAFELIAQGFSCEALSGHGSLVSIVRAKQEHWLARKKLLEQERKRLSGVAGARGPFLRALDTVNILLEDIQADLETLKDSQSAGTGLSAAAQAAMDRKEILLRQLTPLQAPL